MPDVTDEAQVERVRDAVAAELGSSLHILVNNAGINLRKPITDFTLAEWNSVLNTNLTSVFLLCRAFVPMMKGVGCGRIINMTSMMSHISLPGRTAYSASKTALLGFTVPSPSNSLARRSPSIFFLLFCGTPRSTHH